MSQPPETSPSAPAATGKILAVVALLALVGAGVWYWKTHDSASAAAGKAGAHKGLPPVTVATGVVKTGELDIRLGALGSVTPLNTVVVRSRVDGQLDKIHFAEGAVVKAGELLAEIDPRPFLVQKLQAEGQLARDAASLKNAKLDLDRYKAAEEAVTRQQIDAATAAVSQFEGAVKTDEALVDNAKLQLEYSRITAPISGTIGLRAVDAGNIVSTGDTAGIVTITQLQPISVVFSLPENDLGALLAAVGKGGAALKVEALDREGKTILATGTLAAMDNRIDPTTGTLKLRGNFDNTDRHLFPNQFVNVRLVSDTRTGVLLAPVTAVQIGETDRFVYVVNKDETVTRKVVKTGDSDGRRIEITEGLTEGEVLVTDGLDRLRDGAKVNPAEKKTKKTAGEHGAPGKHGTGNAK